MTGVVKEVLGKRRYQVSFQDRLQKNVSLNRLTIVVVGSQVEEELEVREVEMIFEVHKELGFYHWVYISLNFIKEYEVYNREQQVGVYPDTDEEEIKDVVLDDDIERHWRMVFEDNNGGVDTIKAILHANKWYVFNSQKEALVKGGYYVQVSYKDSKKVIWEVVDDRMVEGGVEHEQIGIRGFDFNLFDEEREGCVGDDVKQLPYLLMLMELWPGYWE